MRHTLRIYVRPRFQNNSALPIGRTTQPIVIFLPAEPVSVKTVSVGTDTFSRMRFSAKFGPTIMRKVLSARGAKRSLDVTMAKATKSGRDHPQAAGCRRHVGGGADDW
jgi:hypothetical protein